MSVGNVTLLLVSAGWRHEEKAGLRGQTAERVLFQGRGSREADVGEEQRRSHG